MTKRLYLRVATAVSLVAVLAVPRPVAADNAWFVDALQSMMADLRTLSRSDARTIKASYGPMVRSALFADRGDMETALEMEELALLPDHTEALNIQLRLDGASPIAEKDLANQALYLGARPATLGLLYAIASRVQSGPIEITSLVRHRQYQRALGATNGNARTDVPMHAMGLAFDIALVNTPLSRAYEIRDVLRAMRSAGMLYFIGESQQLVFHVVPAPAALGYYDAVHLAARYAPPAPGAFVPDIAALMQRPIPPPPVIP